MTTQANVLIVDDSAAVRHSVRAVLHAHPNLHVSAMASDGQEAIAAVEQSMPDVVLLDLEMPVMDGLTALRVLRSRWPDLPVVVFSSLSARGSAASIQALTSGAADCVLKPRAASPEEAFALLSSEVVPILLALTGRGGDPSRRAEPTVTRPHRPGSAAPAIDVVTIGSSTGGPMALLTVLGDLGAAPVPVLIVQHMPPMFTADLAKRLADQTGLDVAEAVDGELLRPGLVRIAPGGLHMEVARSGKATSLHLTAAPPVNNCRPAVDPLFASAAATYRSGVLGVVLTGMGSDGAAGAHAIVEAGGSVLVQDEESSVVWGMPAAVARAGLATEVVPLTAIGSAIRRRLRATVTAGI